MHNVHQVHYNQYDIAISVKSPYCCFARPEATAMFDDIHALVEFAEAGSIARAASRLYRTPSAITRQMQRLEVELGAQLLDRSVKPPRLTPLGIRIVEQSREVLKRVDDLKALAAQDAEPSGLFRIGVSHALADGTLVEPVQALTRRFPKIRLRLLSDLTGDLIAKIREGQLDLAVVLLPDSHNVPPPLVADIVARDRMVIVEKGRSRGARAPTWQALSASQWVLNPPGCLLRAVLLGALDKVGPPAVITAEIHNMHLQLAFIKAGYGLGLLPERFVRRYAGGSIRMVKPKGFELQMSIAILRAGPLGSLEAVAAQFKDHLATAFAS
jgi:DNA-binding transcriptional LysR family regulator